MAVRRSLRRVLTAAAVTAATTGTALAAAGPAHAVTSWWVSTAGNDSAACSSSASACATLSKALTKAAAGDIINVQPGTYTDSPIINKAVTVNGTADGVVFKGSPTTYAMAVLAGGQQTLSRLTLTGGHYATGGGLFLYAGSVTANNVNITNSTAANGGGVYVFSGSLTMNGGSVSGNTATATAANQGWGGGIYENANTSVTLTGTKVTGNTVDGAGKSVAYGGGLIAGGVTTLNGATFNGNTATGPANTGYGGAVDAGGPSFTATSTTFSNNTASVGGAFYAVKRVTFQRSTLNGNQALVGGGIYATAAVDLTGGAVTGNKATANYGGGIYATGSLTVDVSGTALSANSAANAGGAIASTGGVTTSIHDHATLAGNTAVNGAAISNAGTLSVADSTINGNNASYQGGAVFNGSTDAADTPSATFTGSRLDGNTAAFAGGALSNNTAATATVHGGTLSSNSAYAGGAVFNAGTATTDGATLAHNIATAGGGGAVFNAAKLTVSGSTLDSNTATWTSGNTTGLGGAVYSGSTADAAAQLVVTDSTLSSNRGYAGSALAAYSTGSGGPDLASISDSTVTGNTATSTSGAILGVGARLSIARSTITGNTAAQGGYGAIATSGATVGVAGTIISGNSGNACSAAATNGGSNLVGTGTTACGLGAAGPDPQLGPLADNGGPTKTQLPGPASPALDKIAAGTTAGVDDAVTGDPIALCGGTDQRGTDRPQGARCDIGAVEADQTVPQVSGPDHLDLNVGSSTDAATYTASGSPLPKLSAADLPAGLQLRDNGDGTATLQGTPTGPGGRFTATITGTNEAGTDSETVTVVVRQAPTLSGPSSDTFTVGQAGGPDVFSQSGGYPAATLSTDSDLPGGVTFTAATQGDTGTGTLAGEPQPGTGGVYPITVTAANGTGPDATWPFQLTVDEAPSLDGPPTATYTVGTHASTDLTVGGFPAPTLTATHLPAGISTTAHGIEGTPAAGSGGEYDAVVTASNGVGADVTHAVHLTVDEAPAIAGPATVRLVAGASSPVSFAATGYPVASISETGALPAGTSLSDNGHGTATLSGTPTDASVGTYHVTLRASNGIGQDASYDVTIEVVPPVSVKTTQLPAAPAAQAYVADVVADGGNPPYDFEISAGSLPDGLTLSSDGHISGTPAGDAGTSTFTVTVTDADGHTATRQLSITVTKGATALVGPPVLLGNGLKIGSISATLTGGVPAQPIAGQTVTFKAGNTVLCSAVTNAAGTASCTPNLISLLLQPILNHNLVGIYAGNARWQPARAEMGLLM